MIYYCSVYKCLVECPSNAHSVHHWPYRDRKPYTNKQLNPIPRFMIQMTYRLSNPFKRRLRCRLFSFLYESQLKQTHGLLWTASRNDSKTTRESTLCTGLPRETIVRPHMNQSHRFGELMNQSHRLGELTTKCRKWNYLHVTMCNGGGFFLACEDFGERFWGKV